MKRTPRRRGPISRRSGFTLIELLVVVAIIALLISILLPTLGRARNSAKDAVCASNLHQLGFAVEYYTRDNNDRLPYILGVRQGNGWTFYQYHQIFNFWKYLKDLNIYHCPRVADGVNDVQTIENDAPNNTTYYIVHKDDDRYIKAYQEGWWVDVDPTATPGLTLPQLYTDYWSHDWQPYDRVTNNVEDNAQKPMNHVGGNLLSQIPFPNYAVMMTDAGPGLPEAELRHSGASQWLFLDGSVKKIPKIEFYDQVTPDIEKKRDFDPYNCRPYWCWGLTKNGIDGTGGVSQP
jgi:prepilin-type N-terminal cleavage/methylation domain-containing protein/prepilin-type processing-associated H-X9-DG protein